MKSLTSKPQLLGEQPQTNVLTVDSLTYAYTHQKPVLQDISFTLKTGSRVGLMGATGSGKSTLLENIIGLKQPQQGKIWIHGILLEPSTIAKLRRHIGFGFQDANDQLFMPTVLEDITFGPRNYGIPPAVAIDKRNSC